MSRELVIIIIVTNPLDVNITQAPIAVLIGV